MALFSLLNWNLESRLLVESTPPTLKSTLSNLHIWVRRSSSFHRSGSCSPQDTGGLCGPLWARPQFWRSAVWGWFGGWAGLHWWRHLSPCERTQKHNLSKQAGKSSAKLFRQLLNYCWGGVRWEWMEMGLNLFCWDIPRRKAGLVDTRPAESLETFLPLSSLFLRNLYRS